MCLPKGLSCPLPIPGTLWVHKYLLHFETQRAYQISHQMIQEYNLGVGKNLVLLPQQRLPLQTQSPGCFGGSNSRRHCPGLAFCRQALSTRSATSGLPQMTTNVHGIPVLFCYKHLQAGYPHNEITWLPERLKSLQGPPCIPRSAWHMVITGQLWVT